MNYSNCRPSYKDLSDPKLVLFNDDVNTFEHVIDCQTHSDHMEHFCAAFISREEYLQRLETTVATGSEINWRTLAENDRNKERMVGQAGFEPATLRLGI